MKSEMLRTQDAACITFEFDRTLDQAQVREMARVVEGAIASETDLRLLLDLRRTQTFEAGAFLSPQGFLASVRSIGPVTRYAVVGAPAIAATAVETFGALLPLKSRAFGAEDIAEARIWVSEPQP